MELPPDDDLFALLGTWGIRPGSAVVLVGTMEPPLAPPYSLADAPRAAATLYYAGVANAAVLDEGYPRRSVEGVLDPDRDQEIIAHCGVGGYASTLCFVLTRMLGYRDVKIYDGATEAWVKTGSMVSYCW